VEATKTNGGKGQSVIKSPKDFNISSYHCFGHKSVASPAIVVNPESIHRFRRGEG